MSPGLVLDNKDCPNLPDPRKQKVYRSFTAKLQFAASWILFDIALTVSSLARICASAGPFGGTASFDGVPPMLSKLQARLSPAHRDREWIIWLR